MGRDGYGNGRDGAWPPGVERVMRAVAQAHVWTGVPITVHVPVDNEPGSARP